MLTTFSLSAYLFKVISLGFIAQQFSLLRRVMRAGVRDDDSLFPPKII